ncbi:acetylglutamate kinase [Clostridium aminobutyricum]|uniref:Acetylglutamate kinase n=1 Tax=Clostridium aminobutyricum TaxID=33953 RepID=A0A939II28_CLOAM|nr:acetylglutamate kinase [Clostridium aminobutyricum]MBN7772153.1 acetylglutamate kinase [Clostridium aminobutyricum]
MKIDTLENAQLLTDALPYIQKYCHKTIVVKYGGNAMINETLKKSVMKDMATLSLLGIKVVLVHGGGPEINYMLDKVGKESKFIHGLRYTDSETMDVVQMVLAGKVNKQLVALIHQLKGKAIGLCGIDGNMIQVEKKAGDVDLGFVGEITNIQTEAIQMALDNGFIPVIATVGADETGQVYNINADTAAAAIASALKAERLISMTDIRGLLMDKNDEETLISDIGIEEVPELIEKGIINGGMIPKIASCVDAIHNGLNEAAIIDGRKEHSILLELFSDQSIGTLFHK